MTKEVLLALRGLQFNAQADESNVETITAAEYYLRNNNHYVIYDEATEGTGEKTRSIIKFHDKTVELTKRGLVNVHMIFEENRKNLTNYATPFGDILIGIDARKVSMEEEEDRISVDIDYSLDVNYEFLADCKIRMEVTKRAT